LTHSIPCWTTGTPSTTFGSSGVGMYISGEFGRQWLGTSDNFYGVVSPLANFANGIPEPSYNTWNIGIGFTYKVFTLDLRYYDTNLSKGNCNAFTSDYSTTNFSPSFVTAINPGGFGSYAGTPIINQPQVAILGVGAIEKRPSVVTLPDGTDSLGIRTKGMLTMAYDHRIVDGADADRFLADLKRSLENFSEDAA